VDSQQPDLHSARLILRPAGPAFAQALLCYQQRNCEHLVPWGPIHTELSSAQAFLAGRANDWGEGRGASYLLFLREDAETVVGTASLFKLERGMMQGCTMGYGIDRSLQGTGLMREALAALIGLAFGPLGLHRIQANYQADNVRSAALLERLGFAIEGRASQYLFLNGAWRDHVLTALINPDFAWADPP